VSAAGSAPASRKVPRRVVSLVPSLTESLFDLNLDACLVGITDYCVHPAAGVAALPRLGGTKNPDCQAVLDLQPDLVLANQEENRPEDVERLRSGGLEVWVTFPQTVRQAMDMLWELVRRFNAPDASTRLATLEHMLDWTRAAALERRPARVFCPIWRHPAAGQGAERHAWWMTANRKTYLSDLLGICGGENVFADRERRYPLAADLAGPPPATEPGLESAGRDRRYPRITLAQVVESQPEVVLLPDEPYAFGEADRQELIGSVDAPATRSGRVHLVDGSLLTWHGTRLARALRDLPPLLAVE
jgi:ABC-type Fe3+-hydroxamate transport system substrate-binding protein